MASISATPPTNPGPNQTAPLERPHLPDAPHEPQVPDLRLVIEEDEASGTYVYKTVDRRTGEVVSQVPREEVLQMRREGDYIAGQVISARA